ncbi:MAG: imelysin family protein [Crocinitomicaceae bacterium]
MKSYSSYLLLSPYSFESTSLSHAFSNLRNQIDLTYLNESYIDYTQANANSGIINNFSTYPNLTKTDVLNAHLIGGPNNISIGFHAMEFILWGEDLSVSGPGSRPSQDLTSGINADRRRVYLLAVKEQLKSNFTQILDESTFEKELLKLDATKFKDLLFVSLIKHIDYLSHNLIIDAVDIQNESYELDKFSDKTTLHLLKMIDAISLYLDGRSLFAGTGDYYLIDFINEIDTEIGKEILEKLSTASNLLKSVTVPFDQAILDLNQRETLKSVSVNLNRVSELLQNFQTKI